LSDDEEQEKTRLSENIVLSKTKVAINLSQPLAQVKHSVLKMVTIPSSFEGLSINFSVATFIFLLVIAFFARLSPLRRSH